MLGRKQNILRIEKTADLHKNNKKLQQHSIEIDVYKHSGYNLHKLLYHKNCYLNTTV